MSDTISTSRCQATSPTSFCNYRDRMSTAVGRTATASIDPTPKHIRSSVQQDTQNGRRRYVTARAMPSRSNSQSNTASARAKSPSTRIRAAHHDRGAPKPAGDRPFLPGVSGRHAVQRLANAVALDDAGAPGGAPIWAAKASATVVLREPLRPPRSPRDVGVLPEQIGGQLKITARAEKASLMDHRFLRPPSR